MVKKIIAGISALALSLSAFTALVSAAEVGDVTLGDAVGKKTPNASTGAQYLTISSEAMIGKYNIAGEIYFAVEAGKCVGLQKSAGVGLSYYDEENDETLYPSQTLGSVIPDAEDDTPNDGYDTVKFAWSTDGDYAYSTEDGILAELGFKPVNKTATDMEIKVIGGKIGACNADASNDVLYTITDAAKAVTYVSKSGTCKVETKSAATPTPTATATPTPTPVVTEAPTPEPTPEVTPEPTTGKGAITADANDAAAWAWKTAAAAGSSVKVTVNANGETATKAFALKAAVDGTVKVGVIVQYNPATFTSFEITDIVVE